MNMDEKMNVNAEMDTDDVIATYWRVRYTEEDDSFTLETTDDGGKTWELVLHQKCVDGELISYKFVTTIRFYTRIGIDPFPWGWNK